MTRRVTNRWLANRPHRLVGRPNWQIDAFQTDDQSPRDLAPTREPHATAAGRIWRASVPLFTGLYGEARTRADLVVEQGRLVATPTPVLLATNLRLIPGDERIARELRDTASPSARHHTTRQRSLSSIDLQLGSSVLEISASTGRVYDCWMYRECGTWAVDCRQHRSHAFDSFVIEVTSPILSPQPPP